MTSPEEPTPNTPDASVPLQEALATLHQVQQKLLAMRWEVARAIERVLNTFASRSFGSKEANKAFVIMVNKILQENAVRLVCPTCETPSLLFLQTTGTTRRGLFQFQHQYRAGRQTRHAGSTGLPAVTVIPITKPKAES